MYIFCTIMESIFTFIKTYLKQLSITTLEITIFMHQCIAVTILRHRNINNKVQFRNMMLHRQ